MGNSEKLTEDLSTAFLSLSSASSSLSSSASVFTQLAQKVEERNKTLHSWEASLQERTDMLNEISEILEKKEKEWEAKRDEVRKREEEVRKMQKWWEYTEKRMKRNFECVADAVNLNVGGHRFTTTKTILTQHKNSFFTSMFSSDYVQLLGGEYFINRDPTHFRTLLHYLQNGMLRATKEEENARLRDEFDFYGIPFPGRDHQMEKSEKNFMPKKEIDSKKEIDIKKDVDLKKEVSWSRIDVRKGKKEEKVEMKKERTGNENNEKEERVKIGAGVPKIEKEEKEAGKEDKEKEKANEENEKGKEENEEGQEEKEKEKEKGQEEKRDNKVVEMFTVRPRAIRATQTIKQMRGYEGIVSEWRDTFLTWLPEKRFEIIYKATEHGFSPADYNVKCYGETRFLVIIQSDDDYFFGGYIETANSLFQPSSFLFTLSNPHSLPPTSFPLLPGPFEVSKYNEKKHICLGAKKWFSFDLEISAKSNLDKLSYLGFPISFKDTNGKGKLTFTGTEYFTTKEIEVYRVPQPPIPNWVHAQKQK